MTLRDAAFSPIPHTIEPRRAVCAAGTSAQWPDPPADGRTEPHAYELVVAYVNEVRQAHGIAPKAFAGELDQDEIYYALSALRELRIRNRLTEKLASAWARARAAGETTQPAREGDLNEQAEG